MAETKHQQGMRIRRAVLGNAHVDRAEANKDDFDRDFQQLITEYAWDYHFDPGTNIVDVVINRLRKKVDGSGGPRLIQTVRGVGYVLKAGKE